MRDEENENDELTFEEALAGLRPRSDRLEPAWRSLLAKEAVLTAALAAGRAAGRPGEALCCAAPAGHRFLCVHCGVAAPAARPARRWAWSAALAAVSWVAAALLVMLLVERRPAVGPITNRPEQEGPSAGPISNRPSPDRSLEPTRPIDLVPWPSPPVAAGRAVGEPRVLSAADTELPNDLPLPNSRREGGSTSSMVDIEVAQAQFRYGPFLQRLLNQSQSDDRARELSVPKTRNRPGGEL